MFAPFTAVRAHAAAAFVRATLTAAFFAAPPLAASDGAPLAQGIAAFDNPFSLSTGLGSYGAAVRVLAHGSILAAGSAPNPYRHFRYCVRWGADAGAVAGVNRMTTRAVAPSPEPGARSAPLSGRLAKTPAKYVEVTLEQGVSFDSGFIGWATALAAGGQKAILINEFNEAGQSIGSRNFSGCQANQYKGFPDLDAGAAVVRIAYLRLRCSP